MWVRYVRTVRYILLYDTKCVTREEEEWGVGGCRIFYYYYYHLLPVLLKYNTTNHLSPRADAGVKCVRKLEDKPRSPAEGLKIFPPGCDGRQLR